MNAISLINFATDDKYMRKLLLIMALVPMIAYGQSEDEFSSWKEVRNSHSESIYFRTKDLTKERFLNNSPRIEIKSDGGAERGYMYIVGIKRDGGLIDTTEQFFDVDSQNPLFSPSLSLGYSRIKEIYFNDFSNPAIPKKTFPSGDGYAKTLFQDKYVTLKYSITLIYKKECVYEDGTPFAAYYYKGHYELINHTGKKLLIKGGIHASPHLDARPHITSLRATGKCLGCYNTNNCSKLFYFAWDGPLPPAGQSVYATFMTEIPNEQPSWKLSHRP